MASTAELQSRVDHLEDILRTRDRVEAETKAAAIEAANKTADAKTLAARTEAASAEVEAVRRGSWVSHLLATADQSEAVNFASLASRIPGDQWPPGVDPNSFTFTGGILKPADTINVAETHMGKAFAALAPIKQ
jgi:hypothetical protein